MSMTERFLKMWVIIAGYVVVSMAVIAVPAVTLRGNDTPTTIIVTTILVLAGLTIASAAFIVLLVRCWAPSVVRQARSAGLSTSADVIVVTATGWRTRSGGTRNGSSGWRVQQGGIVRPSRVPKYEYRLRVNVQPPDVHPDVQSYEAIMFSVLATDDLPKPGDRITVKVHPQRPDIVVLAENSSS